MKRKHALWLLAAVLVMTSSLVAVPVMAQAAYTSPTFGFSVTLPAGWEIDSETSDDDTDVLRFSNADVVAFLTSFVSEQSPAACIDEMVATIQARPNHDNFSFAVPVTEEPGRASGTFGYTFVSAAGETLSGRDRMTCYAVDGGMVRLEFLMLENDLASQETAIAEVEALVSAALQPLQAVASPEAATPLPTEEPAATPAADAADDSAAATPDAGEQAQFEDASTPEPTPTTQAAVEPSPTAQSVVEPTPTGTIGDAPEPPAEPGIVSGVSGNSYTSPSFGYGLTWSDAWVVTAEETDTRGDYLGLENEAGIFADLIGERFPADSGNCFDYIVGYYTDHEDYTSVVGTMDSVSAAPGLWDFTGQVTATSTSSSGSTLDLLNYISCSHVPGQLAIVSLEQVVLPETFAELQPEMDALRQGFAVSASGQLTPVDSTPTAVVTVSPVATETGTTTGGVSAVSETTYTSPTYGYRLSWDPAWTVDQESADATQDYLSLTNGPVYAELLSEAWDPTQGNCFEWIVSFYESNSEYTDVRASLDAVSAVPGAWDMTGAIAMTRTSGSGERINYVSCSVLPGQDVVVSLEQFVNPINAPGQLAAMDALREGFSIS